MYINIRITGKIKATSFKYLEAYPASSILINKTGINDKAGMIPNFKKLRLKSLNLYLNEKKESTIIIIGKT